MKYAAIFDLDGVLVDTAKYHYLAWKQIAAGLGFEFPEEMNSKLKGVSRTQSLKILLELGGLSQDLDAEARALLTDRKNEIYLAYINELDQKELLSGVRECLQDFRSASISTALGSASKNADLVLTKLELKSYFDVIVDGNSTAVAKPNPEVFLIGAEKLGVDPENCIVFEDSQAGLDAARTGGMKTVAVGSPGELSGFDLIVSGLDGISPDSLIEQLFG